MPIVDQGIYNLGSHIRGLSPNSIGSVAFGLGSDAVTGSEIHMENEVTRTPITWSYVGSDVHAQATLSTTEANGSFIKEIGMCEDSAIGSDIFSRDISAIGSKNSTFSVIVEQTIRIRRY